MSLPPAEALTPRDLLRWTQILREHFSGHVLSFSGDAAGMLRAQLEAANTSTGSAVKDGAILAISFASDGAEKAMAAAQRADALVVVHDDAGAVAPDYTTRLQQAGLLHDQRVDFSGLPFPAACFRDAAQYDLASYAEAAATALTRLQQQHADAEERLALRLAQLDDAQLRIEELQGRYEKALEKYHENREKKNYWRNRCKALESSRALRCGTAVLAPFVSLGRTADRLKRSVLKRVRTGPQPSAYHQWRARLRGEAARIAALETRLAAASKRPTLQLITCLSAGFPAAELAATARSLRAQREPNWRWLIAAAGPVRAAAATIIGKKLPVAWTAPDALSGLIPTADFLALLEPGDELEPDALAQIALALAEQPDAEILYVDEDQLDARGWLDDPFFKPDWSPDTFLAGNYLGHFTFVKSALAEKAGGLEPAIGGALVYDFLLRTTELTDHICHLPEPLLHTRRNDLQPDDAALAGLRNALKRRGVAAEATSQNGALRVRYEIREPKKITIVIPTRDRLELLERCVRTIEERTDYPRYEIVIVDNDSQELPTFDFYRATRHRVLHYAGHFNFSAMNNYAVAQTNAEWLLLLNNDMEIAHADWLGSMAEHIQRPEVGVVGAQLAYPNGTIQHAGVAMGVLGIGAHAFRTLPVDAPGVRGQLQRVRNVSAVTGACLLTRREVYQQVGGLDELTFPVNFNDIDFCLKVRALGLAVVYTPYARLIHHESASRGRRYENSTSARAFFSKWAAVIDRDPFYNIHLTREAEDYAWVEMHPPRKQS